MENLSTPHHFFYVYVLKSNKDGKLYIGRTSNLIKRLEQHNKGEVSSTKYRKPLFLVYYESYRALEDAKEREKKLKQFKNSYKELKLRISHSILKI